MNKHLTHILAFAAALAGTPALAGTLAPLQPVLAPMAQPVEADCYAIGEDKAAELGGTLAKAKPDTDGGAAVCRLVIVVPGAEGERPKRVEVVVPQ